MGTWGSDSEEEPREARDGAVLSAHHRSRPELQPVRSLAKLPRDAQGHPSTGRAPHQVPWGCGEKEDLQLKRSLNVETKRRQHHRPSCLEVLTGMSTKMEQTVGCLFCFLITAIGTLKSLITAFKSIPIFSNSVFTIPIRFLINPKKPIVVLAI